MPSWATGFGQPPHTGPQWHSDTVHSWITLIHSTHINTTIFQLAHINIQTSMILQWIQASNETHKPYAKYCCRSTWPHLKLIKSSAPNFANHSVDLRQPSSTFYPCCGVWRPIPIPSLHICTSALSHTRKKFSRFLCATNAAISHFLHALSGL